MTMHFLLLLNYTGAIISHTLSHLHHHPLELWKMVKYVFIQFKENLMWLNIFYSNIKKIWEFKFEISNGKGYFVSDRWKVKQFNKKKIILCSFLKKLWLIGVLSLNFTKKCIFFNLIQFNPKEDRNDYLPFLNNNRAAAEIHFWLKWGWSRVVTSWQSEEVWNLLMGLIHSLYFPFYFKDINTDRSRKQVLTVIKLLKIFKNFKYNKWCYSYGKIVKSRGGLKKLLGEAKLTLLPFGYGSGLERCYYSLPYFAVSILRWNWLSPY